MSRLHEAAPVLSVVLVLILPMWLRHEPTGWPASASESAAVAEAVEAVPYRIGKWAGRDAPLPDAAVRLLRPNAALSRQFAHLERRARVDLVFIHCGDARDMLGHYPPVCYPSNGWVSSEPEQRAGERVDLSWRGRAIPARLYGFSRSPARDWADETRIRVFNFFILPDGTVTSEIDDVSMRTHWLGATTRGVAQVQVLTFGRTSMPEAIGDACEILEGVSALLETLGVHGHG